MKLLDRPILVGAVVVLLAALFGYRLLSVGEDRRRARFLQRFESSFDGGARRLVAPPQIADRVKRGIGIAWPDGVEQYVIDAVFELNGRTHRGRWLYTCNEADGGGIYRFSYSKAEESDELPAPSFQLPGHRHIPWATRLVEGVPSTAGAEASVESVTTTVVVAQPLIVTATAPPGTTCWVETFPPDAIESPSERLAAREKGGQPELLEWSLRLNPKYANGKIRVQVHCEEPYGNGVLHSITETPHVELLPAGDSE
ncbi:hypothetical protein [Botrimarina sp.]|uniref:hypothetical protein n=1 Tax=Botrimarina sp. TaxID=2795802 RepID=UPI0032EB8402